MPKKKNKYLFISAVSLLVMTLLLSKTNPVLSAAATHVVISEIMVGMTGSADNDFVELYNPTDNPVDVTGWRLRRESNTASSSSNLVASMSGSIASRGYLLVGGPDYNSATASADLTAADGISANNTVLLYSDAGTTLVDKVGMGTAVDHETTSTISPANGISIERKANSSSSILSMMVGGLDALLGNAEDSDNNGADFVSRANPQPQNQNSALEPLLVSPTPSASASASPTASPSATPSATPSASPSATPSATPTATPSATPVASPSPTPSATPSAIPSATPLPSPTMMPTPQASVIANIPFLDGRVQICTLSYYPLTLKLFMMNLTIQLPRVSCSIISGA